MSNISNLTAQVTGMTGCASPQNCCDEISTLRGTINTLSARISGLEGDRQISRTALQRASDAINTAGVASARANALAGDVNEVQNGLAELGVQIAIAVGLARAAMTAVAPLGLLIARLGTQIAALFASLATLEALVLPLIVAVAGIAAILVSHLQHFPQL